MQLGATRTLAAIAMLTILAGLAVLAVLALGALGTAAAQPEVRPQDTSWTATSRPTEVIAARQALMLELSLLMRPVDALAASPEADAQAAAALRPTAESIERLLQPFPHLFPPPTNLYDERDALPATSALPAIWQSFEQFYAANEAAIRAAQAVALAAADEMPAAAAALRAACDGCHALYLKAYAPPAVSDEDREIDFDSLFQ